MKPSRILLVGLVLLAGILLVLNPGPEKFKVYLQETLAEQAEAKAREATGGNVVGDVAGFLANRLGRRAGDLASDTFSRDNYYVASVYRVDANGRQPGGEIEFLGIADTFFPLKMPKALEDL